MLLNKRQIQLLRCLLYASTDVSIDALADELSCSTKTVQRDIKIIKEYEEEHHYQLINKKGSVSICCEDSVKDSMFEVLAFLDEIEGQSFVGKRRLDMYLDLLLTSPNPTSIKALSEKYYVSNSSVVNDLNSIEETIQESGLNIEKTRKGTRITGSEIALRNEIARVLSLIQLNQQTHRKIRSTRLNNDTNLVLSGIYGQDNVAAVENCVTEIERTLNIVLGDIYYVNIVTHILITIERMKNKKTVKEERIYDEDKSNYIFTVVKNAVLKLSQEVKVSFPSNEIDYIYTHFHGSGFVELPDQQIIAKLLENSKTEVYEFCNELIERMGEEFKCSYDNDSNLFYSMLLHVNSMLTRIKYNVRIKNSMKDRIMQEYEQMFSAVKKIVIELKNQYYPNSYISDDELAYLCLYFQLTLESKKTKRVVLCCSTGIGTSHLLKKRIQNTFPDIEIIDAISLNRLKKMDLSEVDFVISTIKMNEKISCPVVNVSVLLDQRDVEKIQSVMKERK